MADKKTLAFALMDPPYENARSTTALRLIHIAAKRGYDISRPLRSGLALVTMARTNT